MKNFEAGLKFVLKWEGGYSNHKDDPGGATNKGITQTTYDKYRKEWHMPLNDVRQIGDEEVNSIYIDIWVENHCGVIPSPLDIIHFDTVVNTGPTQANKFLQRSVGAKDDRIIGPISLMAIQNANVENLYIIIA